MAGHVHPPGEDAAAAARRATSCSGSARTTRGSSSSTFDELLIGREVPEFIGVGMPVSGFRVSSPEAFLNAEVSRLHAKVFRQDRAPARDYRLVDMRSTCGTYLNGDPIPAPDDLAGVSEEDCARPLTLRGLLLARPVGRQPVPLLPEVTGARARPFTGTRAAWLVGIAAAFVAAVDLVAVARPRTPARSGARPGRRRVCSSGSRCARSRPAPGGARGADSTRAGAARPAVARTAARAPVERRRDPRFSPWPPSPPEPCSASPPGTRFAFRSSRTRSTWSARPCRSRGRRATSRTRSARSRYGRADPHEMIGVAYLRVLRGCLHALGATLEALRLPSLVGGVASLATAGLLARALLPGGRVAPWPSWPSRVCGGTSSCRCPGGTRCSSSRSWTWRRSACSPRGAAARWAPARRRRRGARDRRRTSTSRPGSRARLCSSSPLARRGGAPRRRDRGARGRVRRGLRARRVAALPLSRGTQPALLRPLGAAQPRCARSGTRSRWLPAFAAAADALPAPWLIPDPEGRHDLEGASRLGWIVGIPVAVALARALRSPRQELSGLLCRAGSVRRSPPRSRAAPPGTRTASASDT